MNKSKRFYMSVFGIPASVGIVQISFGSGFDFSQLSLSEALIVAATFFCLGVALTLLVQTLRDGTYE
ncbi:MAG: hypothetical protein WEC59_09100 [Salibacteraceae bacterium]